MVYFVLQCDGCDSKWRCLNSVVTYVYPHIVHALVHMWHMHVCSDGMVEKGRIQIQIQYLYFLLVAWLVVVISGQQIVLVVYNTGECVFVCFERMNVCVQILKIKNKKKKKKKLCQLCIIIQANVYLCVLKE
eukprot:TRINITY_DN5170_c0_g1_i3.p2 TRINITY_DN5170_c0_g1~~TRINITY_DN5170_c0_g1_i3.p2  ORF type:complete len:132 (-),score=5.48 TRINITY_DN5170_c0_g1_i3:112-507(-)